MTNAGTVDTKPRIRYSSSVNLCTWHKKPRMGRKIIMYVLIVAYSPTPIHSQNNNAS